MATTDPTPERMATIYVLCDSREADPIKRVRYVGRTVRTVDTRLRHHWRYTNGEGGEGHRAAWMRSVVAGGGEVILSVVAVVPASQMDAAEMEHVAKYRALGCDLTNKTDGGGGSFGYRATDETRRKLSVSHRGQQSHLGIPQSEETRAKLRAANLGKKASQETCDKISAALRGHIVSPEVRAKISLSHRGIGLGLHMTDEARRNHAEACRVGKRAKLSWASVATIRALHAGGGLTHRSIGHAFGVSGPVIANIVNLRTWISA